MLAILDQVWNEAIDAAAEECKSHALSLRSMNGESEAWVWPAADSTDNLVAAVLKLKRE